LFELGEEYFVDTGGEVNSHNTSTDRAFWDFTMRMFAFEIVNVFDNSSNSFAASVTSDIEPMFMLIVTEFDLFCMWFIPIYVGLDGG
jgi:hypothetical protein